MLSLSPIATSVAARWGVAVRGALHRAQLQNEGLADDHPERLALGKCFNRREGVPFRVIPVPCHQ